MTPKPRLTSLLLLVFTAACGTQTADPAPNHPPAAAPTLSVSPGSSNVSAGGAAITFSATVQNSAETVSWAYTGPGSIAPPSGPATSYTPPASVTGVTSGSLSATLGGTGETVTVPIAIYPASATPPVDPPPVDPPPVDPPPVDPPPVDPPPAETFSVTIAAVEPVSLDADGAAAVNLFATTRNAPSGLMTFTWTADETPAAANFSFVDRTLEDTDVLFYTPGTYKLRLTATNGSQSAADIVTVTVNPAPANVSGLWEGQYTDKGAGYPTSLDLTQKTGDDVTGTWTTPGGTFPMEGTFDGTELTLTAVKEGFVIKATISGENMSGTMGAMGITFPFTATRKLMTAPVPVPILP